MCLAIRQRVRCLAVDARGHGDSDWSAAGDYSLEAQVLDVEALVERLGLDQFILVGMSMGGGTAIAYAGRNARKLTGLVIVDTGPGSVRPARRSLRAMTVCATSLLDPRSSIPSKTSSSEQWDSIRRAIRGCCGEACCTTCGSCPMVVGPGSTTASSF